MNRVLNNRQVLVLCSGGIDSTACIDYYKRRDCWAEALWIDYGQRAAKAEQQAFESVAVYYGVPQLTIEVKGIRWSSGSTDDELIGRNLLFASIALSTFSAPNGLIAMGIHSGTDYADCSTTFQERLEAVASVVSGGYVNFDFPFGTWDKADIFEYCLAYQVPVHLTYSCLVGTTPPCGRCSSCRDRADLEGWIDRKH